MSARHGIAASLVYVVMLPQVRTGDWLVAALLGMVVAVVMPRPESRSSGRGSLLATARAVMSLAADVLVDTAMGTWRVMRMTFGARLPIPGFVRIPLGGRSPSGAALHGLLVTISPGSVLVSIEQEEGVMIFHVAGVDAASFERRAEAMYRKQATFLP